MGRFFGEVACRAEPWGKSHVLRKVHWHLAIFNRLSESIIKEMLGYIDGLVQERRNSSAWAMELRLSCTISSIYVLTFLELKREYSSLFQLMPWLLASPGHQQPCYWLCRMNRSLPYMRKDVNYTYLYHFSNDRDKGLHNEPFLLKPASLMNSSKL